MINMKRLQNLALSVLVLACLTVLQTAQATIVHTGTDYDVAAGGLADFQALGYGQTGYYFPQFDAGSSVTERPTWENMAFSMPSWISFQFDISQADRTFSPDAGYFSGDVDDVMDLVEPFGDPIVWGVYSEGGDTAWDDFKLPSGVTGLSGSVVDEAAANNSNNSVNRIQLGAGTPSAFFLRIVVDNTNGEHDPIGRLRARGDSDVRVLDEDVDLQGITVNGNTDIYTFLYTDYQDGDFIKIQLNSGVPGEYPGFGGLMVDIPEPSSIAFGLLGLAGIVRFGRRRRS